jgi:hypothetical protein
MSPRDPAEGYARHLFSFVEVVCFGRMIGGFKERLTHPPQNLQPFARASGSPR